MSIDSVNDIAPRRQYVATAAQEDFDYPFPIFEDADLVADVDGVTKALNTHYSVSGAGEDAGGTVSFVTPMVGGEVVTIYRDIAIARDTDFQQNGPFRAAAINDELDKAFLIMQELESKVGRAIRFPITAEATDAQNEMSPLSNWLGKFLRISSAGILEAAEVVSSVVALTQSVIGALLNPQTAAESGLGINPPNKWYKEGEVLRYGTNATPGTTDMTAAIQAANDVMAAYGVGGKVIFPAERLKTTAEITRSPGVSFIGQGRFVTWLEGAHEGIILSCVNPLAVAVVEDQFAEVTGIGFTGSGAFTPSHGVKYRALGFTKISDVRFADSVETGIYLQFVLNSRFDNMNIHAGIGLHIYSTSTADGTNLNKFVNIATSGCATAGLLMDAHGSYQNEFDTCAFFNQAGVGTAVDHVYACRTRFVNCTQEANLSAASWKLRGGDGITFEDFTTIDPYKLIDSATFGARNVVFIRPLLWDTDSTTPNLLVHDEISLRDPIYTLDEANVVANTHEEHHLTGGHHSTGRQFAHFPGYLNASASHAKSHITPFGGQIPTGAYNRAGSWDFTDSGQWSVVGTSGAADPFGGTTAYNMNTIANSTHGGFGLGSAATGRTFTFQVWARFIGRVRLGIGTTTGGIQKFANFYSSYLDDHLLAVTYTSPTDAGTTPLMSITTDQNTVMWRPCHYESFGPLPALTAGRNLASIVGPIEVEDTRIKVFRSATPTAGAFAVGDTIEQSVPVAGNPKRWRCTVAGTGAGATYVSEGNL